MTHDPEAPVWNRLIRTTLELPTCRLIIENGHEHFMPDEGWFWRAEDMDCGSEAIGYVTEADAKFAALWWYFTKEVIDPNRHKIIRYKYNEVFDTSMFDLYELKSEGDDNGKK